MERGVRSPSRLSLWRPLMNASLIPADWFVYAEDLVAVAIGPFDSHEDAKNHVVFCAGRGDGGIHKVITADDPLMDEVADTLIPEEDRNLPRQPNGI